MKSSPLALLCMLLISSNANAQGSFDLSKISNAVSSHEEGLANAADSALNHWTSDDMRTAANLRLVLDDEGKACRTVGSLTESVVPDTAAAVKPPVKMHCEGESIRRRHLEFVQKMSNANGNVDQPTTAAAPGVVQALPEAGDLFDYTPLVTFSGTATGIDANSLKLVLTTDAGIVYEDPIEDVDADGHFVEPVSNLVVDTTYFWSVKYSIAGVETQTEGIEFMPRTGDENGVSTRSSSGSGGGTVPEAEWTYGGADGAVGQLYFKMPDLFTGQLAPYTCTGTVVTDHKSGRSLILTAAHCLYDDIMHAFASNVLFVPDEKDKSDGGRSSWDNTCSDDPCGCWEVSGAVVHEEWKTEGPFPGNHQYDFGFFVVKDDASRHKGAVCGTGSEFLDESVKELDVDVTADPLGQYIHGVGYHAGADGIRYCAETVTTKTLAGKDSLFIPECDLLDGASGGPWLANVKTLSGEGTVVGVNSWGYMNKKGMGGPVLDPSGTRCLANTARETDIEALDAKGSQQEGVFASCFDRGCSEAAGRRKLRGGEKRCRD